MAAPSSDLLWLLLRKQHKFLVKRGGNNSSSVQFSTEPNNLLNKHSFKYSGLANKKTVGLTAAGDGHVELCTTKTKKGNLPRSSKNRSLMKKDTRKVALAVINQVVTNRYRPDLKKAAMARLSAIHKSFRVIKAGAKKPKPSKKVLARRRT
eukprot:SM000167S02959  [mRNA]  locus=s167:175889:176691:- [translate_table: standard]